MGAFHSANISKREGSTMNGTEMSRTHMSKRKVSTKVPWENSHVMHSHWNANLQPLNCYDWLKTFCKTLTQHSCIEHFETITWLHLNTIGYLNICRINISLLSLSLCQVICATTSKSKRELHGSMQRTPHIKCQRHRKWNLSLGVESKNLREALNLGFTIFYFNKVCWLFVNSYTEYFRTQIISPPSNGMSGIFNMGTDINLTNPVSRTQTTDDVNHWIYMLRNNSCRCTGPSQNCPSLGMLLWNCQPISSRILPVMRILSTQQLWLCQAKILTRWGAQIYE
jgi:hypothetical protein